MSIRNHSPVPPQAPFRPAPGAGLETLSPEAQQRLGEILERYLAELELGRRPDLVRLAGEHPDLGEHLKLYAASLDFLQQAAGGIAGEQRSGPAGGGLPFGQLGDYQILGEIGRGGMGIVYEARQISLDRRVALKVLPLAGLLDPKQIARFQQEARAAAQLHHPHIAPIYCVGCERGVHYYAMQYIEGQSLEATIRELREARAKPPAAATESRAPQAQQNTQRACSTVPLMQKSQFYRTVAQLGIQAAEALQHAHDYGVIHRDVKPSNLLLDAQGKLWVTDFGLAHCHTDAGLTVTGDMLGTLRYMSPEQAEGKASLIDPRCDVYSLGITLYELLTLRYAFEGQDRGVLLRSILEQEPVLPRRIDAAVPVDLETIVLKAISKSREARYTTAQELADDLRRYLESKPTRARRPSPAARVGKWAKRHQGLVWATAAVAAVAVLALVAGSLLVLREHAQTRAALARAEAHYQQARRVVDRFAARHAEQLIHLPGAEPLRRELLTETLGYYQEFIALAGSDPALQSDLAATQFKAAGIQQQLGASREAADGYRAARQRFEQLLQREPDDPRHAADLALCDNNLGLLLSQQGKIAEAETAYRQAIARQQELVDRWPGHAEAARFRNDLATSQSNLALLEDQAGQLASAESKYRAAIALQQALVADHPREPRYLAQLATSYNNLSFLYAKSDAARAGAFCRQALELQQKLVAEYPQVAEYQSDLGLSYNNLGALESRAQHPDAAKQAYQQAVGTLRGLVGKSPAVLAYRRDLAVSLNNLGRNESLANHREPAQAAFEEAREILVELVHNDPQELSYRSDLGGVLNNLAMLLEQDGQVVAATKVYAEAIEHQRWALAQAPTMLRFREFLAQQYDNYGRVLRTQHRTEEAAQAAVELQKLRPDTAKADPNADRQP